MADDPKKTGDDRKQISLKEPHEVRSWTDALGVTEQKLRAAVAAVGDGFAHEPEQRFDGREGAGIAADHD